MTRKKLLSLLAAAVFTFTAFSPQALEIAGAKYVSAEAAAISAPTSSKKSGTYTLSSPSMKIKLSTPSVASIYYSLNGASYRLYTKEISITKNSTIKAYSKSGSSKSGTVTFNYKLSPEVTISHSSKTYEGEQTVKLTSKISGVKFYYTTDGTKPTTSSKLYNSSGIKITKSTRLRVLAYKTNWNTRSLSRTLTIKEASSAPAEPIKSNVLTDYKNKWAYNTLSSTEKKLYERLYEGAEVNAANISAKDLRLGYTSLGKVFWAFDYDNPQFLNIDTGYKYTYDNSGILYDVKIVYRKTAAQAKTTLSSVDDAVSAVLKEAKSLSNDYQRVKLFHDWIINRTDYTLTGPDYIHEIDGPILYKKALCEGYSRSFSYLCQSAGIPCVCVAGKATNSAGKTEDHMWNMVRIGGKWYHVDVTWDDPVSSSGKKLLVYDYFLKSDAQMKKNHSFKNYFTMPTASSNYAA